MRKNGRGNNRPETVIVNGDGTETPIGGTETSIGAETSTEYVGDDPDFIDPSELDGASTETSDNIDTATRKKRGRPKGYKLGTRKEKKISASLEGIEGILLSCHTMLAAMTKIPELQIDESESKKMADAIARVAMLYDLGVSEKTIAWTQLCFVLGGVYGTRFFAYTLRMETERKNKMVSIDAAAY